ncbi:hypothetical protein POTOM_001710 [Populus tomentosa]|uniref:RNase H type-1 domain-containing protein n=1 Tax=Populus tomentosa TaxID=118781 RepID=A0A8X8IYF1_POPTO|nr:hypothetical protein POTOM_001710 [Populus tomentosa]
MELSVNRHRAGEDGRLELPFARALNVDACNKGESGLAGAGGLIRDNAVKADDNYALIIRAREILAREREVHVQYTFREGNFAADWLTSFRLGEKAMDRHDWIIHDLPVDLCHDLIETAMLHLI